jgi:hypothetical protein
MFSGYPESVTSNEAWPIFTRVYKKIIALWPLWLQNFPLGDTTPTTARLFFENLTKNV